MIRIDYFYCCKNVAWRRDWRDVTEIGMRQEFLAWQLTSINCVEIRLVAASRNDGARKSRTILSTWLYPPPCLFAKPQLEDSSVRSWEARRDVTVRDKEKRCSFLDLLQDFRPIMRLSPSTACVRSFFCFISATWRNNLLPILAQYYTSACR